MTQIAGLNMGQSHAAEKFFEFLFGPDKEMIISGPGGCGKTHLMGYMIDEVIPHYHNTCKLMGIQPDFLSVQMTATTNQAAEELSKATRRPCKTIHSFMNLRVTENHATGGTFIKKTKAWCVHRNTILFVDEAPMIDTILRNLILEGTCNCKIVYVGDDCQLAPVKEPISPIYKANLLDVPLIEPMRTNIPELQLVNDTLRSRVPKVEFGAIQLAPGLVDWLDGPAMEQEVIKHFSAKQTNSRIMAYTNDAVIEYNAYVRGMRGLPNLLTDGEYLVCNSAYAPKGEGNETLSVQSLVKVTEAAGHYVEMPITETVKMWVQYVNLEDKYGNIIQRVPVPADRAHYKNLLKYFGDCKDWSMYFFVKNNFPDLRERDSSTVYKAQGSTYDISFIDVTNISSCNRPDVVARMLYVATSRARQRIIFYGDLAPKYGHFVW